MSRLNTNKGMFTMMVIMIMMAEQEFHLCQNLGGETFFSSIKCYLNSQ